jgi:predicted PurR-regulated permease PerM
VKLSPPATMVAALVGVSAGGVVGALFAVPLLGASKAIYLALRDERSPPDGIVDAWADDDQAATGAEKNPR